MKQTISFLCILYFPMSYRYQICVKNKQLSGLIELAASSANKDTKDEKDFKQN